MRTEVMYRSGSPFAAAMCQPEPLSHCAGEEPPTLVAMPLPKRPFEKTLQGPQYPTYAASPRMSVAELTLLASVPEAVALASPGWSAVPRSNTFVHSSMKHTAAHVSAYT